MSLQRIINVSNSLEINRRKMVGIQYTRNEVPRVTETPTFNAWRLRIGVPNVLRYSDARQIIETLDTLDRRTPEVISFNNVSALSWMFRYQGTLTPAQRERITFNSFTGNQLTLAVTGITGATANDIVLEQGDFLQIQGFPYPFTSTTRVLKGTGTTVTVTTHRPNIFSTDPLNGTYLNFGNDVQFNMFCPNMPIYKLIPGGAVRGANGQLINNAYIQWSDLFDLYEWVASA